MNFTNKQIQKAKKANSVEELLLLAKENGLVMSEEQAKKYYAELHKEGVLSDEELLAVTGGSGKGEPPTPMFKEGDYVDTYFGLGHINALIYSEEKDVWYYSVVFGFADPRLLKESEISLHTY